MEWIQFITLMATMIAGIFAVHSQHREDIKRLDDAMIRMDAKWERLFERLLIKEGK